MPASEPVVSSIASRASFPSTMPLTRKMPKNRAEFCMSGEVSLPPICGAKSDIADTAMGIATR